jgi:Amt family ammonium transporter
MDGYYAWMLVATAFVLVMTVPALALFYGGMTRSKSVLNMMMMSFVAFAVCALGLVRGLGR